MSKVSCVAARKRRRRGFANGASELLETGSVEANGASELLETGSVEANGAPELRISKPEGGKHEK